MRLRLFSMFYFPPSPVQHAKFEYLIGSRRHTSIPCLISVMTELYRKEDLWKKNHVLAMITFIRQDRSDASGVDRARSNDLEVME